MASTQTTKITAELLRSYSNVALRNADELLVEASLLREHGHYARAYFLAVACIEEAGKALLAFDAQNRNLNDPAIWTKLRASMESHEKKIIYALCTWASDSTNQGAALKAASDLIFHLKGGREPSMYTDLRNDPDRAQTPREIVRAEAARDCIRLAKDSVAYVHRHVIVKEPFKFTVAQNRLFTMKASKLQAMLNTKEFWLYFIARMEAGEKDIAEAVLGYERDHVKSGTPFPPAQ